MEQIGVLTIGQLTLFKGNDIIELDLDSRCDPLSFSIVEVLVWNLLLKIENPALVVTGNCKTIVVPLRSLG